MIVEVKEHPRYSNILVYSNGFIYRKDKSQFAKNTPSNRGYFQVSIEGKMRSLHRVVAEAFLGEIPEGMDINHKDGVKTNNDISNLEIATRSQNMIHAYESGLMENRARGERSGVAKYSDEQRRQAKELLLQKKFTCRDISRAIGTSDFFVYAIKSKLKLSGDL